MPMESQVFVHSRLPVPIDTLGKVERSHLRQLLGLCPGGGSLLRLVGVAREVELLQTAHDEAVYQLTK